jgi:hypothetical protein
MSQTVKEVGFAKNLKSLTKRNSSEFNNCNMLKVIKFRNNYVGI